MPSVLQSLAGKPLVRRAVDALFAQYARRRVRRLDHRPAAQLQHDTLLRLVRHAAPTRFGRDHGFDTVRSVADYQQRVPLRDYEQFWQQYWQPAFPHLDDVTWPGRIPYFALSSGTTSGSTKYVPVTRAMVASNQKAGLTSLALFLAAHPGTPLFNGRIFFLGGSSDLTPLGPAAAGPPVLGGDLSGIAAREVGDLLRPYTFPPLDLALLRDWDRKVQLLAERSAELPVTVLGGVPSWLLLLFERLRQVTGREHLADVWPTLRVVIHGGAKFDPTRALFRRLSGSDAVHFLEVYPASEGFVATEDPRHGLLRLIPDHNLFFEFVPVEELGKDRPARHTVADLEPGVQYAVVLTTCAGLWSYVLGDTVCFERRNPPLLRFTGRTRYFLSAFGEHLISEEVERAVAAAAEATGAGVVDFHVGPVFPETAGQVGRHRYLVEFAGPPRDVERFAAELDATLCRLNEDYQAHRAGDLTLRPPEVVAVRRGGFADWLRAQGKLGGQHKVPRMDNSGRLTQELSAYFQQAARMAARRASEGSSLPSLARRAGSGRLSGDSPVAATSVRIGNGCGFWGDNRDAPVLLAEHGRLDYLTLEYLAELTMSILALQKQRDPQTGFAGDFLDALERLGPQLRAQPGLKVVTNAGGMNPAACAARARALLDQAGLADRRVAVVQGDDLLPRLDQFLAAGHPFTNLDTGEPLSVVRTRVVSANAYLGARPIVDALRLGAAVVITGRVADASLTLGPTVHGLGWAWDDWDRLAAGTVAGHLVECGAQATGGLWCNWQEAPDLGNVGYPVAVVEAGGTVTLTKPPGTGGAVNRETVAEQLLYEVGDPAAYLTPDVTADFTSVRLSETGRDMVRIEGAHGKPATASYKVSIAYRDGFTASGTLVIFGPGAAAKARRCGEMILERLRRSGLELEASNVECLGAGDCVPGVVPAQAEPPEVVLRVTVRDSRRAAVERFTRELAPLVTSGPPGVTGYTTGRPPVREVFAYWPALVDKSAVTAEVSLV